MPQKPGNKAKGQTVVKRMQDRKRKRLLATAALVLAAALAGWCLAGPLEILKSEYALQRDSPAAVWKLYEREPGRPVL